MSNLRQGLQQRQLQKISQQQILLMKLLQVPTAVLEQRIQDELEENPALEKSDEEEKEMDEDLGEDSQENFESEEGDGLDSELEVEEMPDASDEIDLSDYMDEVMDDDVASYKLAADNSSPDDEDRTIPMMVESSFQEHLEEQLGMLDLTEEEELIALQIIGSIDDDGYLRRDPAAIVDDLAFSQNISTTTEVVQGLVTLIQQFDPPGVGARDLRECLILQLKRKAKLSTYSHRADAAIALKIIEKYFEEFSKKHYDRISRSLGLTQAALKNAVNEILRLSPKPGGNFLEQANKYRSYIVPDFLVENKNGELELSLNALNLPELRISDQYRDMLREYSATANKTDKKQKEAVQFIKQKIDSAKWFVDAIRQRYDTMFRTMAAILVHQRQYFLTGDERTLRPMILKDIADVTELDISTISRVANGKYVQTEFGTKRLKEFFSEALNTDSGEEVSALEVKNVLKELIDNEDKSKPLSDERLKELLEEKGYDIARRTIAKYREQLDIPVARLRKEL